MIELIDEISKNPLIHIPFSVGLIFIAAGFIMFRFPPKTINSIYGYRTTKSMESQEKWDFSQKYSSIEMMKLGLILSISSLLGFITTFNNFTNMIIGLGLMLLMVITLIWRVEKAIKEKFKNN